MRYDLELDKVSWLINKSDKNDVIGFIAFSKGAAYVIGGPTGSHFTGHGESWEEKLKKYIDSGYLIFNEARKAGIINNDWKPPAITSKDKVTLGYMKIKV